MEFPLDCTTTEDEKPQSGGWELPIIAHEGEGPPKKDQV